MDFPFSLLQLKDFELKKQRITDKYETKTNAFYSTTFTLLSVCAANTDKY